MTRPLRSFDAWVARGPFTPTDLGRYRVLLATSMLVGLVSFEWVAAYPDSLFTAPIGPFRIFDGFPPRTVLLILELALAVAIAALMIGLHTGWASVAVSVLLMTGSGFAFSLGKIDHTIFSVLVPVVLALGRWGGAVSVDAVRSGRPVASRSPSLQAQWPLRLLALLVGVGMLTAAAPKLLAGWLCPATQAVRETALRQYHVNERTDLLAGPFVRLDVPPLWEALDWATVLMEGLLVLTVLNWRAFRCGLAVLTLFHLGVHLTMNITFAGNVLVYAAFVAWSRVPLPDPPARWVDGLQRLRWLVVLAVGAASWGLSHTGLEISWVKGPVILWCGAVVAAWYLLTRARDLLQPRPGAAPVPAGVRERAR